MLLFLLILPLTASGHPGKTDPYGGHRCLKGCSGWDLLYNEYHTHDKDGRPVRDGKRKKPLPVVAPAPAPLPPEIVTSEDVPTPVQATVLPAAPILRQQYPEAELLPLPWALVLLLLFWLLQRRTSSRERSKAGAQRR